MKKFGKIINVKRRKCICRRQRVTRKKYIDPHLHRATIPRSIRVVKSFRQGFHSASCELEKHLHNTIKDSFWLHQYIARIKLLNIGTISLLSQSGRNQQQPTSFRHHPPSIYYGTIHNTSSEICYDLSLVLQQIMKMIAYLADNRLLVHIFCILLIKSHF